MKTLAGVVADAIDAGRDVPSATFSAIPRFQLQLWWGDVAAACPSRRAMGVESRRANALNVEIGAASPRCMERSPDGRGLAWALSGGSLLAYGNCERRECPRLSRGGYNG